MTRPKVPLQQRFDAKWCPEPNSGCWLWTGATSKGYGNMGPDGKAYRISYELNVGPIPHGLVLDHLCRNTHCVNPDHLEPVTQIVNVMRGAKWMPTHCKHGHEFNAANTIHKTRANGAPMRQCRPCQYRSAKESRSRAESRAESAA